MYKIIKICTKIIILTVHHNQTMCSFTVVLFFICLFFICDAINISSNLPLLTKTNFGYLSGCFWTLISILAMLHIETQSKNRWLKDSYIKLESELWIKLRKNLVESLKIIQHFIQGFSYLPINIGDISTVDIQIINNIISTLIDIEPFYRKKQKNLQMSFDKLECLYENLAEFLNDIYYDIKDNIFDFFDCENVDTSENVIVLKTTPQYADKVIECIGKDYDFLHEKHLDILRKRIKIDIQTLICDIDKLISA